MVWGRADRPGVNRSADRQMLRAGGSIVVARMQNTLKDVYFAENKILKTLPKMATAAQSPRI
jgi:Domain of unknown function (DUF892)